MFNKPFIIIIAALLLFLIHSNNHYASEGKPFLESVNSKLKIAIIDPFTNNEIMIIHPSGDQLLTDIVSYRQELEELVHDLSSSSKEFSSYPKPMILDRVDENGEIIKGRPLITVDEPALVEKILHYTFAGGKIKLPLNYTQSGYNEKDVPYLNEVVLSSYTTHFNAQKTGRSRNIELSSLAIDQVIVGHNDIFSFNLMVGPREVATGYQMAPEIVKGKMVMGIGGGICQTSSTLFNAIDPLQLEIIERHHHSRDIGYVPKGRDATVSFGGLDFKFKNTAGIPFLIKTYYRKGSITVQIKTSKEYEQILKNEL